jgi:hypothetical protein
MAYFRSVKESGGGDTGPIFSSTILYESTTDASTLELSDDYHNYDLIKVTLYNVDYSYNEYIFSPEEFDELCNNLNVYMGLFPHYPSNSSRGYCITPTDGTTLTRRWYRNCLISKIEGLNCTNKTITKTILHSGSTNSNIVLEENINNYDFVSIISGSGNLDEVGPFLVKPNVNELISTTSFVGHGYNNTNGPMWASNDGINFAHYGSGSLYVLTGYKFT